jgi:hypothetical protein
MSGLLGLPVLQETAVRPFSAYLNAVPTFCWVATGRLLGFFRLLQEVKS